MKQIIYVLENVATLDESMLEVQRPGTSPKKNVKGSGITSYSSHVEHFTCIELKIQLTLPNSFYFLESLKLCE